MRFKDIKKFKVDDLLLDVGNYRFMEAPNQKACIEKIYASNTQYFKNLMSSIALDDLGELLLVYKDGSKNIVLDGNRRLSILKVFSDPKKYSPSEAIKQYAIDLMAEHHIDLTGIQAQVSSDQTVIYKTVYERHAAGQGKARIGWSAYGAARFRYDQQMEEDTDWYSMALILETEKKYPIWSNFIDSKDYSHEVFRRIFRSALDKGVISRAIFSDKNQRIKTSVDKKILTDAIEKTNFFLKAMQGKDLSLSRGGKYADKSSVDSYINTFKPSPDNVRSKPPASGNTKTGSSNSSTTGSDSSNPGSTGPGSPNAGATNSNFTGTNSTNSDSANSPGQAQGSTDTGTDGSSSGNKDKQGYGVERSEAISQSLKSLNSSKFLNLYNSLCTVSLKQHPQLLYTGAWSFFESLTNEMGKNDKTSFNSFLGSKFNNLDVPANKRKDFPKPLKDISETGNLNKHSGTQYSVSAEQLRADFITLEPLIIAIVKSIIELKKV